MNFHISMWEIRRDQLNISYTSRREEVKVHISRREMIKYRSKIS
jgi:hypothetical protein